MELTLNVDEKKFNDLIQGELDNFSEQEIHEICKEGFMKCLSNENTFRKLFVGENGYYSSERKYYANDLLKEAAQKVDLNPLFEDFQQKVLTFLQEHHDDIIRQLMEDIFISGLSNCLYNSNFMNVIRNEFGSQIISMQKNTDEKIYNAINSLR